MFGIFKNDYFLQKKYFKILNDYLALNVIIDHISAVYFDSIITGWFHRTFF